MQTRSTGQFAKERVMRLIVPWAIVGLLLLVPPQVYLERLSHGDFTGNFFQFIPEYFKGSYEFGEGNFPMFGLHLWFLLVLFVYSTLLLPLFTLNKQTMKSLLSRFSKYFEKWWALLLLFVPLFAMEALTDVIGLGQTRQMASWSTLTYMLLLAFGYLIFSNEKILAVIKKYAFYFLGVAVVFPIIGIVLYYVVEGGDPSESTDYVAVFARVINLWLWVLAIIGLGMRFLKRNNGFLRYANEAVLPFYILHQTIIIIIGYFIVQWDINVGVKYVLVLAICFPIIVGLYHFLIKRFNVLRFLFGMRAKKKKT